MMSGGKMSSREFEKCLCVAMRGSVPERMKLPGGQKWETAEQGKQFGNGRRRVHEQEKRLCDEQRKMAERGELLPGETAPSSTASPIAVISIWASRTPAKEYREDASVSCIRYRNER